MTDPETNTTSEAHNGMRAPAPESSGVPGWEESPLWVALRQKPGSERVQTDVQKMLEKIEPILRAGATSTPDFTLHDAGHSFRVSKLMRQVISDDVFDALSIYELALLLLSAYLHDIGMTPTRSKERAVFDFLASGSSTDLDESELKDLQRWLDDEPSGSDVPIVKDSGTPDQFARVRLLTAHYIRHRHNDWSVDWIHSELADYSLSNYVAWLSDLEVLCDSHHRGYNCLAGDRFDARQVGVPAQVVNLRYLAAVLRIADILEFDPERTPEVVFRHREVARTSAIFWAKDHGISPKISANRIFLSHRPGNAQVHKAIEDMLDQIDVELAICRRLSDEIHFDRAPYSSDLPYRWDLPLALDRDVKPEEGLDGPKYVYMDGAFRPNTQKLLELLSGHALYGKNPLIAVRELIQNAFDAIKEQIAFERLRQDSPSDSKWESVLGEQHKVTLHLEQREEFGEKRWWLVCTDDGVGMSKEIIQNHLLVSGTARRHEIVDLERQCKLAGFRLGRTGKFGIGVLAYFMLGDRVEVRTRRSDAYSQSDHTGWHFATDGIGSFGELRKCTFPYRGCQVALRIVPEHILEGKEKFLLELQDYLLTQVVWVPCKFVFVSTPARLPLISRGPGWVRTTEEWSEILLETLELPDEEPTVPKDLIPRATRERLARKQSHLVELRKEAESVLRWLPAIMDDLENGLGRYRILFPYFALSGGACASFLRMRRIGNTQTLHRIGWGLQFSPGRQERSSWHGIEIERSSSYYQSATAKSDLGILEIDFTDVAAGEIQTDRHRFFKSAIAKDSVRRMRIRMDEAYRDFFEKRTGDHNAINSSRYEGGIRLGKTPRWGIVSHNKAGTIINYGPVIPPVVADDIDSDVLFKDMHFDFRGKRLVILASALRGPRGASSGETAVWRRVGFRPDYIATCGGYGTRVGLVWNGPLSAGSPTDRRFLNCEFPERWQYLCGIYQSGLGYVWNRKHFLFQLVTEDAVAWFENLGGSVAKIVSLDEDRARLCDMPSYAAVWLLGLLSVSEPALIWQGLSERFAGFAQELQKIISMNASENAGTGAEIKLYLVKHPDRLIVFDEKRLWERDIPSGSPDKLQDPGAQWTITSSEQRKRERERQRLLSVITDLERKISSTKPKRAKKKRRNMKVRRRRN